VAVLVELEEELEPSVEVAELSSELLVGVEESLLESPESLSELSELSSVEDESSLESSVEVAELLEELLVGVAAALPELAIIVVGFPDD
jgi:hypothetical protein